MTYTADWLQEHSGEVEAIVRSKLKGWDVWPDASQHVCLRLLMNDALSKWDESKGTFRTYLYTAVVRNMLSYFKSAKDIKWRTNACFLNEEVMYDESNWMQESDARLDVEAFTYWIEHRLRPSWARVMRLWLTGLGPTDISAKIGLSKQHCYMAIRGSIDLWNGGEYEEA